MDQVMPKMKTRKVAAKVLVHLKPVRLKYKSRTSAIFS